MTATTRVFKPANDRQRVYAACVDWRNAREYFAEVESDPECVLCAATYRLCSDGPNVAGSIVSALRMQDATQWGNRITAVVNVTKPGAVWFRELITECQHMESVK
jgi:hypothetical protein